ncbi:MAG: L-threonylcarbamoyladenylate synthase [Candidatus Hydrogenedentota bacterium]
MRIVQPDDAGFEAAVRALRAGQIVVHPTDTVYGLAVDPLNVAALDRLAKVKGREAGQTFLLIATHWMQIVDAIGEVSEEIQALSANFWPGPLTLMLTPSNRVPKQLLGSSGKIGVRIPACDVARVLCSRFGRVLVSTSANRTGQAPALCTADVNVDGVTLAIEGGALRLSAPSTIYDPLTRQILRAGAVDAAAIEAALSDVAD